MKNIKYKIEFFDDWHTGSGLTSGADIDALVIKDKNNLPFIPGKTMKGLIKEAVDAIMQFQKPENTKSYLSTFGAKSDKEKENQMSESFFTNAVLSEELSCSIVSNKLQEFLFRDISSTAINENGIAKEHSLRRTETTIPCTLYGEIKNVPDEFSEIIGDGLKLIKRLGKGRNRGLGRCNIEIIK